jgi:hypothetical protein
LKGPATVWAEPIVILAVFPVLPIVKLEAPSAKM